MHLKNAIHANTYIRGYPMLILYIADVERDVGMKKLSQKEAAKVLEGMKVKIEIPKAAVTQWKRNTALDMAIEALKYSEIPNSSDTISRQAAIDALDDIHYTDREDWWAVLSTVENLPPVQPQRMKGAWINEGRIIRCNKCKIGYATVKGMKSALTYNFCPKCGADMRGEA